MAELKHGAHECMLTSPEIVVDGICNMCYKDEPVEFSCNTCNFDLCKTCSMIPPKVSHGFHPQHLLDLCVGKNDGRMLCSWCGTCFSGFFHFKCKECEIYLHVDCGIMENIIIGWDAEELLHYSHAHLLRRCKPGIDSNVSCLLCELPLSPSAICYGCIPCYSFVHQRCLDLPREIQHPVHPKHPLIRLDFTYNCGDGINCNACGLHIDGAPFGCPECNFYIHMRCADSLLRGLMHKSHQHMLFYVATGAGKVFDIKMPCQICKGTDEMDFDSYFHCMECDLKFHFECLEIPESVVKRCFHIHPLFGMTYPAQDIAIEYCGVCETMVHARHLVYSCQECDFLGHIECILREEMPSPLYLKDLYSYGEEDAVTIDQEDISETNKLEKKLTVNGDGHTHVLKLARIRDYSRHCYVCFEDLLGSRTLECEICDVFEVHDYCVKLGKPSMYRFHLDHLLTLLPSCPAGVVTHCETCKVRINGFNLFCRICSFVICTKCMVKARKMLGELHRGQKFIGTAEGKCLQDRHSLVQVMVSRSYPVGCTLCDERLSGKIVSCITCDEIYHLWCIEFWRQERFSNLPHSDHTLKVKLMRRSKSKCTSCKLNITKYGLCCSVCKLNFHMKCSKALDVVSEDTESSHRHTFFNYWIDDWQLARTCNVCSTLCGLSFYGCIDCNFSAHVKCLGFPANVKNQLHQHTLELSIAPPYLRDICSLCGTRCYKRLYYCQHCEDVFHMTCLMSTDEGKAATKEEQLRDVYLMFIERDLLNMVGKDDSHDYRYGIYKKRVLLIEESDFGGEDDSSDKEDISGED